MKPTGTGLRSVVLAALLLGIISPIAAGLIQTGRAAFGLMPVVGAHGSGLEVWRSLCALPGFWTSVRLTLWIGFAATFLSLTLATCFCATAHARMTGRSAARWLAPLLAAPHTAVAIGLAFVLAPSGWIARLLAPLVGWVRPPDLALINDPWGIALILGLMIKEIPFLLLVMLAALSQIPVQQHMAAARGLGYRRSVVWVKIIAPQVWPLIRLPVLVVLAYSLSTVEMGIILGPSNPPVFSVFVMRLFMAPDLAMILPASAGALMLAFLMGVASATLFVAERLVRYTGLWWIRAGGRSSTVKPLLRIASLCVVALFVIGALAMVSLVFWSLAWRWPWPSMLPETWSFQPWRNAAGVLGSALGNTLLIAGASVFVSLALAILWLEGEDRKGRGRAGWGELLIYLPLLLPQIAFLYGLNMLFLRLGISGGIGAVIWAQVLFVFPYVMIVLSDPWRALDPRLIRAAASLGAGPLRQLLTVKIPLLLSPILIAAAIGTAVSVAQYLPTLFMGAGRISTLTTEAVTLSSGADRRITGVYASLQAILSFAAYAVAFMVPAFVFRNRAALKGAGQ